MDNSKYFRDGISKIGLDVLKGEHPIVPIMFGDALVAKEVAERLLKKGIYVIAFSFPVVPRGKARIRTQISAVHSKKDLDFVISMFKEVKEEMNL